MSPREPRLQLPSSPAQLTRKNRPLGPAEIATLVSGVESYGTQWHLQSVLQP